MTISLLNRFRLGVALLCVATLLLWRFWILEASQAMSLQETLGFWMVLGVLCLWLATAGREIRSGGVAAAQVRPFDRRDLAPLILALGCGIFFHMHEPHRVRVVNDEPAHIATSLIMFEEGRVAVPGRTHLLEDEVLHTTFLPTIRMYLFPALLAVLHALSGYRVENVFVLNGLLGFSLLLLVYLAGREMSGRRGGVLAVLLLAGLPLLAQNVTSAGYDVLNLVLLVAYFLSVVRYVRRSGSEGLDLMVLTGLLLAFCRYESVLYLVVAVGAAGWKWWSERQVTLTWLSALSPLAVWPCLVVHKIMWSHESFTLSSLREEGAGFFDIRYWSGNTAEAIYYAFNFDRSSTNSVLLSALGCASLLVFWVALAGILRRKGVAAPPASVVFAFVSALAVGIYAFVLTNFWGMPTESSATRFILPLMVVLALAVPAAWATIAPGRTVPGVFIAIAGVFTLTVTSGISGKATQTRTMTASRAYNWLLQKAEERQRSGLNALYVAPSSLLLGVHKIPCIPNGVLEASFEKVELCLEAGIYDEVLLLDIRSRSAELEARAAGESPQKLVPIPAWALVEEVESKQLSGGKSLHLLRLKPRPRKEDDPEAGVDRPAIRTEFETVRERSRYLLSLLP